MTPTRQLAVEGAPPRESEPSAWGAEPRTGALWTFRRRKPDGVLAGAVAPLRGIEIAAVGSSSRLEVPTGLMNLVFGFGDPFAVLPATGASTRAVTMASRSARRAPSRTSAGAEGGSPSSRPR